MSRISQMDSSTQAQRDYIRTLLVRCELSARRFTYMHRGPWKDACLPEPPFDGDIEVNLRALSKAQASDLLRALQKRAGDDDNEEND